MPSGYANYIYHDACDLLDIPHYVRPSNYNKVIERAGYLNRRKRKAQEERRQHNRTLMERLYRQGEIGYIAHREDLTYDNFAHRQENLSSQPCKGQRAARRRQADLAETVGPLRANTETEYRKGPQNRQKQMFQVQLGGYFLVRAILEDTSRSHLNEIAKAHKIKGYTRMGKCALAVEISKLDDIEEIIIDLAVKNRGYMIDGEEVKYLQDHRYRAKD